jgi:hypothetical protein
MPSTSSANDPEALVTSFTVVALDRGFVIRPSPPWEGASASSTRDDAMGALGAFACAYDARFVDLAREIAIEGVVPRDGALDLVPVTFVDGKCACELWDFRGRRGRGTADVRRLELRVSASTIAREARMIAERMCDTSDEAVVEARALALEEAALAATRPLRLGVAGFTRDAREPTFRNAWSARE